MANYEKDRALILTELPTRALLEQLAEEAAEVGQAVLLESQRGTRYGLSADTWEEALAEEMADLCMCADVLHLPMAEIQHTATPTNAPQDIQKNRIGFAACGVSKTAMKLIRARGNGNPTPRAEEELWNELAGWTDTLFWLAKRMGVSILPADSNPKWERWAERIRKGM